MTEMIERARAAWERSDERTPAPRTLTAFARAELSRELESLRAFALEASDVCCVGEEIDRRLAALGKNEQPPATRRHVMGHRPRMKE